MTSPRPRRRSADRPYLAGTALFLATAGAFAFGMHLRTHHAQATRLKPATQLAQATPENASAKGWYAGTRRVSQKEEAEAVADNSVQAAASTETFENVYALVKEHFVDPLPSDTAMSRGVIKGMIATLGDPNSQFYDPHQRARIEAEGNGDYEGIGAITAIKRVRSSGITEYKIVVVATLAGGPAEQAGLLPGDIITHIDNRWILGDMPTDSRTLYSTGSNAPDPAEDPEGSERIRGGIGLLTAQSLLRQGVGQKRVLFIERPGIKDSMRARLTTAKSEILPASARKIQYEGTAATLLRIPSFTDTTPGEVEALLDRAEDRLVLDLRGNAGGSLDAAKAVDALLTGGGPFTVEVGTDGKRHAFSSPVSTKQMIRPVVVLVDKGTASTSEALAASLSEKGIGTLVGSKTYGDGTLQTLYPLPDGSAFTLTTGKMLTPKGTDWNQIGLLPKVTVRPGSDESKVLAAAVATLRSHSQVSQVH